MRRRSRPGPRRAALLALCAAAGALHAQPTALDTERMNRLSNAHYRNFFYWAEKARWPQARIAVCWENPEPGNAEARGWVRDAVARTWEAESALHFYGWGACAAGSTGVRILIADAWPKVLDLGAAIDGRPGGMILNFAFQFDGGWSAACADLRRCVELVAIHEFGHAIGLSHEHARPDMPAAVRQRCEEEFPENRPALVPIGAWDPESVMNYCNPQWINNGKLSLLDIQGVRLAYGPPIHAGPPIQ